MYKNSTFTEIQIKSYVYMNMHFYSIIVYITIVN